ncbi:hypothetical protein BJ875DRAFT_479667 [Amylocarpus encephaloides]|uniref:RNA polymerase II assembly factor Rtp1 C-terminal domain-containing protein n=1 Tax=Amylocarpus encephaloides TaxID=45428 RepID=A0A9P7YSR9_9HELO|nr:hypothetical protein BJ875DRAFT_479667 [Amylocarpus encephaloides]
MSSTMSQLVGEPVPPSKLASSAKQAQQPAVVDNILRAGNLAFDPSLPEDTKRENQPKFQTLLDSTKTLALIPALNLLVQQGRTQEWLRTPLITALARIPLRKRGVQDTLEFVFTVHPSSRARSAEEAEKRTNISHDALNAASRLLSSPPAGSSAEAWFSGIAPQMISLLRGEGEPEMDRAVSFIIGFGILGRKQYGAPGMPGWKAFVEPMLQRIDPAAAPQSQQASATADIVTLGAPTVLVSSFDVTMGIEDLSKLLRFHPNPALAKRLLRPIALPLWALSSWPVEAENRQQSQAKQLLKALVQLWPLNKDQAGKESRLTSSPILGQILQNLLFRGRSDKSKICWEYANSNDGLVQIQEPKGNQPGQALLGIDMQTIDFAVEKFVRFVAELATTPDFETEISYLFMGLCYKLLSTSDSPKYSNIITRVETNGDEDNMEIKIIQAKILQKLMSDMPDKLVNDSHQALALVSRVLVGYMAGDNDSGVDGVSVALSLLNIVLTSPNFRLDNEDATIGSIQAYMETISKSGHEDVKSTAQNLLMLLKFRSAIDEPETPLAKPTDQHSEDRKSYSLALSYLTETDSPPPVRVQGLELLSTLIRANSPILDVQALLVLFASLLQDADEYIYLRAIKSFIELSQRHPNSVVKELVDRYVDSNEDSELDQRLRLGEALLQVIQNNAIGFAGDTARLTCEGLLFIASRRSYRPKTEQGQEKRNKLKRKQDAKAEEVWGGPVPQLDESPGTQKDEELLSQIVSGWESKRGSEDLRIRASALSILGSALEVNIGGMDSTTISKAIDLSIHILTLETELEQGIVRRSAILLIMSFVRALDTARNEGRKLSFGFVGKTLEDVERILRYVAQTDNDELVRQHAEDVSEGLKTWQINSLLPIQTQAQPDTRNLAGLSITPGGAVQDHEGRPRPRIEEIE